MLKSAILVSLINIGCAPIEQERARMYLWYPDQTHGCQRVAGAILGVTEFNSILGAIEEKVAKDVTDWARQNVPIYIYAPLVAGYATIVEQRYLIPIGPIVFAVHTDGTLGMRWQITW